MLVKKFHNEWHIFTTSPTSSCLIKFACCPIDCLYVADSISCALLKDPGCTCWKTKYLFSGSDLLVTQASDKCSTSCWLAYVIDWLSGSAYSWSRLQGRRAGVYIIWTRSFQCRFFDYVSFIVKDVGDSCCNWLSSVLFAQKHWFNHIFLIWRTNLSW